MKRLLPGTALAIYWPGSVGGVKEGSTPLKGIPDWAAVLALVAKFLNVFLSIGVVAAVCVLFYSGFLLITDHTGDEGTKKKAQDNVIWALVGIVVMLFAFTIVNVALSLPFFSGASELPDLPA